MAGTVRDNSLSGQIVANYRVGRMVGRGGMGAVYEAVHQYLGRRAALKVLHAQFTQAPELTARFVNEARAANAVQHPGVVSVFEIGQLPDGTRYILMEFLDGPPLSQRIRELAASAPLPLPAAGGARSASRPLSARVVASMRIVRQLASALRALHEKGVIHRDLKPDNILIVKDPEAPGGERVKLLDFGIAKFVSEYGRVGESPFPGVPAYAQTALGARLGTPMYMGPELWRAKGNVDYRVDIYSLGCIFFELLTGRPPYSASAIAQLMQMHVLQAPPELRQRPDIPGELAELVHRMLAKDPAERPTTVEVESALDRLLAPVAAQPEVQRVRGDASTMLLHPGSAQAEPEGADDDEDVTLPLQRLTVRAKPAMRLPAMEPLAVLLTGTSSSSGIEPPDAVRPHAAGAAAAPSELLQAAGAARPSQSKRDDRAAAPGAALMPEAAGGIGGSADCGGERSPSGSAQLIPLPQLPRRTSAVVLAGAALLLSGSLYMRSARQPMPRAAEPLSLRAAYPERAETLQSSPPRVEVRDAATLKLLGHTPYAYKVSPSRRLSFVLCQPGYKTRHVFADWDDAGAVVIKLPRKKP